MFKHPDDPHATETLLSHAPASPSSHPTTPSVHWPPSGGEGRAGSRLGSQVQALEPSSLNSTIKDAGESGGGSTGRKGSGALTGSLEVRCEGKVGERCEGGRLLNWLASATVPSGGCLEPGRQGGLGDGDELSFGKT